MQPQADYLSQGRGLLLGAAGWRAAGLQVQARLHLCRQHGKQAQARLQALPFHLTVHTGKLRPSSEGPVQVTRAGDTVGNGTRPPLLQAGQGMWGTGRELQVSPEGVCGVFSVTDVRVPVADAAAADADVLDAVIVLRRPG